MVGSPGSRGGGVSVLVVGATDRGEGVRCGGLVWFPNNVARNFHVNLLNLEIASLELQRLWGVLKTDRRELRARFMGTP